MSVKNPTGIVLISIGGVLALSAIMSALIPVETFCGSVFAPKTPTNFFDKAVCRDELASRTTLVVVEFVIAAFLLLIGIIRRVAKPLPNPLGERVETGNEIAGRLEELERLRDAAVISKIEYKKARNKALGIE